MGDGLSFWRLGEEARLKYVWRPVARVLDALELKYARKATRAIIITPEARYTYTLSVEKDMAKRFKKLDIIEAWSLVSMPGRPTLVTISISPSFLKAGESFTLKNPYVLVKGYPGVVCVTTISGGTVGAIRQASMTPLRINDLRIII